MRRIVFLLVAVGALTGSVAYLASASGQDNEGAGVQFMVKDSPCHEPAKAREFVFTRYAP